MNDIVDIEGRPLLDDNYTHETPCFEGVTIDTIRTAGNLWLSGPRALEAMGFQQDTAGSGYSRRLKRVKHPDFINVKDTAFKFADARRNNGKLISPRAVLKYAEGGVQGFNTIKSNAFVEWMEETLWSEGDAVSWSPAIPAPISLEPVFRKITRTIDEAEDGTPLDPLRPIGVYPHLRRALSLADNEVEFCLCTDVRSGVGRCWCGRKGGIRDSLQAQFRPYDGVDVIDGEDDFQPYTSWPRATY